MKASETALRTILEGNRQTVVPQYQRRFAWTRPDWDQFWGTLKAQYDLLVEDPNPKQASHFFGSFVIQPTAVLPTGQVTFSIVDGQQRLTTAYLLLVALRDLCPPQRADQIHESYLIKKFETGDAQFKLLPGPHDATDLKALVDRHPAAATGLVGSAYRWLRNELEVEIAKSGSLDFSKLELAVIQRLEIVHILTGTGDNIHRIFQTLNSTGRRLGEVDKLRNHFFMLLPTQGPDAYTATWQPMENLLQDRFDFFLWADLVSRGGGRETIPRDGVYAQWQQDLEAVETDEDAVRNQLELLSRRAMSYQKIVDPSAIADRVLANDLTRLNEWSATVHHPVLLRAMVLHDQGLLTGSSLRDVLTYVESFLVRRMLKGTPTNNLNRVFTTTVAQVPATSSYASDLRKSLSAPGKYWPSDIEVEAAVRTEDFYHSQRPVQRQFVLRRLEEALPGREVVNWTACDFTVEHVMPQNLSPAWHEALHNSGEDDPVAAHQELVDTLGNLTLTCENSELSDSPIDRKQEIYRASALKMNRALDAEKAWARKQILTRAHRLAQLAITRWPPPVQVEAPSNEAGLEYVAAALQRLPDARWTSLEDLASAAGSGVTAEDVRGYVLANDKLTRRVAIRRPDGGAETTLPWVAENLKRHQDLLVSLGVIDDASVDLAPPSRRVTQEEFASLLGDA